MVRLWRTLILLVGLVLASTAAAGPSVASLIERLQHGEDFRIRVQAALELGKTKSGEARAPLEGALDDENPSVRVAAAAALKLLGDRAALPALEKHDKDPSAAVRSQIKTTIAALRSHEAGNGKPRVLVKLGKITIKDEKSQGFSGEIESTSRTKLGTLPGVSVLDASADYKSESSRLKLPAVMVTARLRKLAESREGSQVKVSASVEFVVHRLPEQVIAGTVSGSASARAPAGQVAGLRHTVLNAAIDSALRRASPALMAAAR